MKNSTQIQPGCMVRMNNPSPWKIFTQKPSVAASRKANPSDIEVNEYVALAPEGSSSYWKLRAPSGQHVWIYGLELSIISSP